MGKIIDILALSNSLLLDSMSVFSVHISPSLFNVSELTKTKEYRSYDTTVGGAKLPQKASLAGRLHS